MNILTIFVLPVFWVHSLWLLIEVLIFNIFGVLLGRVIAVLHVKVLSLPEIVDDYVDKVIRVLFGLFELIFEEL